MLKYLKQKKGRADRPYLRFIQLAYYCFRTLPPYAAVLHLKVTIMSEKHFEKALTRFTLGPPGTATEKAGASGSSASVVAKLVLDTPNVCPYCQKEMRETTAIDVPVYICDDDRHVVPRPNSTSN